MTFGDWPDSLHFEPEQLIRIERARQISAEDVNIDIGMMSGTILGSKKPNVSERHEYNVDVYSCSYGDFIAHKRPCKHMYRLAMEYGLIGSYSKEQLQEAVGAIENFPDEAQLFLKSVLGVIGPTNYGTFWVEHDGKSITRTSWNTFDASCFPLDCLTDNPYLDIIPVSLETLSIDETFKILDALSV